MSELPIHAVLPELLGALREAGRAVLVAPPGAGKTTAVAPALVGEDWCSGTVILLSPRRVAARAAAERMAEGLGEQPGETVGYLTRLESKRSGRTRILVMTEAIFVATILADPALEGVSAVLFDEAHERHLDSDLGLALAIECRDALREDLRLLVMSATIDGARFAALMGECPVIESAGKAWPLDLCWLGARPEMRIEDAMASALVTAWNEQDGDVLAFLPGVGEIERTRERLEQHLPDALVLPLHGQCDPVAQGAAIRRDPGGRRRVVLATAIAETSLTLDGVSLVVDAGLSRRAEFDRAAGVTRLVTHRASRASADQRAGRAARQGPGTAYRLWEEAAHAGRAEFDPPEIETSDLAGLVLALADWGAHDPTTLAWLDPPTTASVEAARAKLRALGALDASGAITPLGKQVASLPMTPEEAAMVLLGARAGQAESAARLVLLLQERGLGGRSDDLMQRLDRWNSERGQRADASRKLAARWAKRAEQLVGTSFARGEPAEPRTLRDHQPSTGSGRTAAHEVPLGILLAMARPDLVARRRDLSGENWLSAGGRGYVLDAASPLARTEWLVIGDAQGQAKGARILAAVQINADEVDVHLGYLIERRSVLRWNEAESRSEARLERRMGAIVLASGPDPQSDAEATAQFLLGIARERLSDLLPAELIARARHAGITEMSPEALADSAEQWLAPMLAGRRDLDIPRGQITEALLGQLDWDARQALDRLAPRHFTSPAGTGHAIDYADAGGASVEVRVQALFGLDEHPMIGKPGEPLLLKLTSPAGRPIQTTRDLPGFWRGTWRDVQRDMKGRYPKHRWPDEPWAEKPSLKTKNAFSRGQG